MELLETGRFFIVVIAQVEEMKDLCQYRVADLLHFDAVMLLGE